MKECSHCGGELLKGHEDIGICAWCMIEIDRQQAFIDSMPVPSYCSDDDQEIKKEDNLPTPEEYM